MKRHLPAVRHAWKLFPYLGYHLRVASGTIDHELTIKVVNFAELNLATKQQYDRCIQTIFKMSLQEYILRYSPPEQLFLGYNNGRIVTSLYLVERCIQMSGRSYKACGVGGVFTKAKARNLGYARRMMNTVQQHMFANLKVDLGLLLCSSILVEFYAKLGWNEFTCPVYIQSRKWTMSAMTFGAPDLPSRGTLLVDGPLW